jgi:anti-anti-sigma factor
MSAANRPVSPPFALSTAVIGDSTVGLTVGGELGPATVGRFEAVLCGVLAKPGLTRLVLDLAPLTSLDASGVRTLQIAGHIAQRRGITLTAVKCGDLVRRALENTELYRSLFGNGESTGAASATRFG